MSRGRAIRDGDTVTRAEPSDPAAPHPRLPTGTALLALAQIKPPHPALFILFSIIPY